jgi:hypothetical protein
MNKDNNAPDDYEMAEDYSAILKESDLSKARRGKYYQQYRSFQGRIPVTIKSEKGDRHLNHLHFETEAKVTADGKLIAEAPPDIAPGKYRIMLVIEEPRNPPISE